MDTNLLVALGAVEAARSSDEQVSQAGYGFINRVRPTGAYIHDYPLDTIRHSLREAPDHKVYFVQTERWAMFLQNLAQSLKRNDVHFEVDPEEAYRRFTKHIGT